MCVSTPGTYPIRVRSRGRTTNGHETMYNFEHIFESRSDRILLRPRDTYTINSLYYVKISSGWPSVYSGMQAGPIRCCPNLKDLVSALKRHDGSVFHRHQLFQHSSLHHQWLRISTFLLGARRSMARETCFHLVDVAFQNSEPLTCYKQK